MLNLTSLFQGLPDGDVASGSEIIACTIPGLARHRLGKGDDGSPLVLISAPQDSARTRPAPIKLEHLSVQHDVECRISNPGGVIEEGHFTVVACRESDVALQSYFLRVLEPVIELLGPTPARSDITRAVFSLVELFRALTAAPRKSVQGLWGEMFLIVRAPDAVTVVDTWHSTPEDKYDFNWGSQRLEVKSVAGRRRVHHFSLEQLQPPEDTTALIASVFVERSGGGTSLAELLDRIRRRLGNNLSLLMHVDKVVGATLGSNWRLSMDDRFDYELAKESLAVFEAATAEDVN